VRLLELVVRDTLFGIDVGDIEEVRIEGCDISSRPTDVTMRGDAIRVWSSDDVDVIDNYWHDARDAVAWYSDRVLFEHNRGVRSRYSVHSMYSKNLIVRNNFFEDNSVGVFLMYGRGATVVNNEIRESTGAAGIGLGLKETSGIYAEGKYQNPYIWQILSGAIPFLLVLGLLYFLFVRQMRIAGRGAMNFGKSRARMLTRERNKVTFTDVAMTTSGSLVTETDAARWRSLGLTRLTLSLDSLRDERVRSITRARTDLASTIRAIEAAKAAGLGPVKVNAVVVRGRNDDEIADFADFARDHDVDVRLIEWMPLDSGHTWSRGAMVTAAEMLEAITARHRLEPADGDRPDSTSMNYRFADGGPGRIGLIASVTRPFCGACSRLRITADGKVRPCLFSTREWDLRPVLRDEEHAGDEAAADGAIRRFLIDAVWTKQAGHGIGAEDFEQPARGMSAIGG